ncbi:MAG: alpha/beta fold hydrolase [Hyphomicrobiaceae bacterium]
MEERVTFSAGDAVLEGLLSLQAPVAKTAVVVCHPHPLYGGEMHNNVVEGLVVALRKAGHATLRFNFRGVGGSSGEHGQGVAEIEDVKGAISCLLDRQLFETLVVAGYSFGSMVGLKAGAEDARVHKLIGVALPCASRDVSFLNDVSKPTLLISGDRDDISPVADLQALHAKLRGPKDLVILRGADHFFRSREIEVADAALKFLDA